jgi:hypothetical protein
MRVMRDATSGIFRDVAHIAAVLEGMGIALVTNPVDTPCGRYVLTPDLKGHSLSVYRFASAQL